MQHNYFSSHYMKIVLEVARNKKIYQKYLLTSGAQNLVKQMTEYTIIISHNFTFPSTWILFPHRLPCLNLSRLNLNPMKKIIFICCQKKKISLQFLRAPYLSFFKLLIISHFVLSLCKNTYLLFFKLYILLKQLTPR